MSSFPAFEYRDLPKPPHWKKALGVGVVVVGLAVGTGELILWPHLIAKHGLGLLWLAFLGILFQYFINQEVARHTLATGESFFTSSARLFKWLVPFWFFSAIILYVWPAWAGILGTILKEIFGFGNYLWWAAFSYGLILFLTFSGRIAYLVLERSLKIIIPVFFSLLVVISFLNINIGHLKELISGFFKFGYIPVGVDINVLLGAIVFAGAGGMLNLCVSLWYRDKDAGMGKYIGRIANPVTGKPEAVTVQGYTFPLTKENLNNWKGWLWYLRFDQGFIFAFLGFISILLLSLNAYAVLYENRLVPEGLQIAVIQANIFGQSWGIIGEKIFLIMAFLMLFSVMWTVIDALTRIVSDIIHTNSRVGPFEKRLSWLRNVSLHHLYYSLIVGIVIVGLAFLPFKQPFAFLIITSVLSGISMAIYTPFLIYLNNARLPALLRPGIVTNLFMAAASLFYIYFSVRIISNYF